jgi:hypothetical protein
MMMKQPDRESTVELFLESATAELKAAKAQGDKVVRSVESLTADIGPYARGDAELIRLLDVLSKRVITSKESLAHLERALVDNALRSRGREMTESAETGGRKAEIRAAWLRISEHTEGLRRIAGELIDLRESEAPLERLAAHATGVRVALSDLEWIAASITAERTEQGEASP